MIARCAIRSGSAASPRSAGIIPGATAWKVNAAARRFLSCARSIMIAHSCNPKRLPRSAPRRILFCVRGILDGTKEVRNYL